MEEETNAFTYGVLSKIIQISKLMIIPGTIYLLTIMEMALKINNKLCQPSLILIQRMLIVNAEFFEKYIYF